MNTKTLVAISALGSLLLAAAGCDNSDEKAIEAAVQPPSERDSRGPVAETLSDAEITAAVERELFADPVSQTYATAVQTTDGIVSLTGTVDNLLAKQRSERLAGAVKGVRSISNQIQVAPPKRDDTTLKAQIIEALIADPTTDSFEVDVQVHDQDVTLKGEVDSWQESKLTELIVEGVTGVRSVDNQLEIDFAADRMDSEIKADVEGALKWDALVDSSLISVSVQDGRVELSGTVGSVAERQRANTDAWVAGTKAVVSRLEVRRWARDEHLTNKSFIPTSDDDIADAIHTALLIDPRVSPFDVHVDVDNGRVALKGEVSSAKAKRTATSIATNTTGVLSVNNDIEVQTVTPVADALLETRVSAALLRNPVIYDAPNIDVTVDDGVVTLTGEVDNFASRAEADDVASAMLGVREVVNRLRVTQAGSAFVYDPYVYPDRPYHYTDPLGEESSPALVPLRSDIDLAEDIREQLFWSPFVNSEDIVVVVDNGAATLTGTVDSPSEKSAAIENAFEGGAVKVKDSLVIRPD